MKNSALLYALIAGVSYGAWPLLARGLVFNASALTLLVSVGTAVVALVAMMTIYGGAWTTSGTPYVGTTPLLIALAAGAINGIGTLAYSKILGTQGIDVSQMITLVIVLMIVTVVVGAALFFGEGITFKKALGIVAAIISVVLLS